MLSTVWNPESSAHSGGSKAHRVHVLQNSDSNLSCLISSFGLLLFKLFNNCLVS